MEIQAEIQLLLRGKWERGGGNGKMYHCLTGIVTASLHTVVNSIAISIQEEEKQLSTYSQLNYVKKLICGGPLSKIDYVSSLHDVWTEHLEYQRPQLLSFSTNPQ